VRLPPLQELTPRQAEISEQIAAKRGGTRGPFLIWLRSPELCERVDALGAYCRFESSLPLRLRELSLLIAARHFDAQYSWNAHAEKAVEAGIKPEAVGQLAENKVPDFADREAEILYNFATQVLRDHFVDDETFAAGLAAFGEQGLVDLIGSLGNYSMLAMLLNTFQVDLKPGWTPPYPDVRGFQRVEPGAAASA
jgi:4-carboxymuconolactone decarboxylase